jgi:putative acetyltransferase
MIHIKQDDLRGPEIAALLQVHLDAMFEHSPAESVHALDLNALRAPDITFWSAWDGDALVGCGALKERGPHHGEIKSMRTDAAHLGKGVGAQMLAHIIAVARERGYTRLSLETGPTEPFWPAHRLYARHGFETCEAFGGYDASDPFSVFMTLAL